MDTIETEEMRASEDRAEEMGVSKLILMENAGASLASEMHRKFPNLDGKNVVILVGGGNNGGDGMVCARHLVYFNARVSVFLLRKSQSLKTSESITNWQILSKMGDIQIHEYYEDESMQAITESLEKAYVIVDAIIGTGVKGKIREPDTSIIDRINSSSAFKMSVDIPSGLDPSSGEVHDKAVQADLTITFHKAKVGLIGNEVFTGQVIVSPIGMPLKSK